MKQRETRLLPRGGHAHKECWQFLFLVCGQARVHYKSRLNSGYYELELGSGLVLPPWTWVEIEFKSVTTVINVLASHEFDIEERIKRITAEQLGVEEDEITNDKDFVNDLFSDSLDSVELIMAIEDEFELEIMDEDAEFIKNVQDAIDYVKKHYKS